MPPDMSVSSAALRKVSRRLIPFLFLLYLLNYLDRVNVGFAALEMNRDLGFSASVYGFGAGVFFLGYCLFEVPSNLILLKVGARIWIARIMVSWGLVASAMLFVRSPASFYGLRFLLGLAEAGFFPGIILYLTFWYPARERARAYAWFLAAIPISGMIGGPISGALLGLHGWLGLTGWQVLFLLEGVPSVIVGVLVLVLLPDRPADARWLAPAEHAALDAALHEDRARHAGEHDGAHAAGAHVTSLRHALRDAHVWLLGLVYFLMIVGLYAFGLWLPQLLKSASGLGDFAVGLLSAVPYAVAAAGMVLVGVRSDRAGERHRHVALPALVGAAGFLAAAALHHPVPLIAALSLVALGVLGALGPFWALPTAFLEKRAAAGGIALINSMGALGGFVGPYLLGVVKDRTGSFAGGLVVTALMLVAAAVVVLSLRRPVTRTERRPGWTGA
ncbi:MAG TPA: MFS transporter [Gemmatimonadales bacterium]|nr:MFS transporter [Gemmatimonadales bacterium]